MLRNSVALTQTISKIWLEEVSPWRTLDTWGSRRKCLVSVKVYLEGGGRGSNRKGRKGGRSEQSSKYREGFSKFVRKVGLTGKNASIRALREQRKLPSKTFARQFESGEAMLSCLCRCRKAGDGSRTMATSQGPQDNWNRPEATTDDHCHLMVQVMESWFLADTDALKSYLSPGIPVKEHFQQNPKIEQVS